MKRVVSSGTVSESQAGLLAKQAPILKWPGSIPFNLAVSLVVGLIYVFMVCGPRLLNPRDTSWIHGDVATYFIAWGLFRQDPNLHWPLTFTKRVGYPVGDSIALMDPIPLLALIFKPFSPILPTPFQYLGIAAVVGCALQFFFSLLIFRFLLRGDTWGTGLSSLFFLLAPPFTFRLVGHYALVNQWLLLASIYLLIRMVSNPLQKLRWFICYALLLALLATTINPYLAFLTVTTLLAAVISLVWQRRMNWAEAVGMIAGLALTCIVGAAALGLLSGIGGNWQIGYRSYSMNLLAPIDPYKFRSILFPQLPQFTRNQYEGYNYMGAGVLMLALISLPFVVWSRRQVFRLSAPQIVPLAVCCLVLTVMATSTQISFGSRQLLDLDPAEHLSRFLATLRVSGRLFWVPYYVVLIAILVSVFLVFDRRRAILLMAVALAVQIVDTSSLREWVRSSSSANRQTPLNSPIWSTLGTLHQNLLVMPAWQCDQVQTPGGLDGFSIFGFLAVSQRMRTNSYYAARYSDASLEYHCSESLLELLHKGLSPNSAYVVNNATAALIELGPSGIRTCHEVDGFLLCSSATDFGLNSTGSTYLAQMGRSNRIRSPNAGEFLLTGWYYAPGSSWAWSNGHGVLAFVLDNDQRSRYTHLAVHLKALVGPDPVQYSVLSTASEKDGSVPGTNVPSIVDFNVQVFLRPTPIQVFEVITKNPPRPYDIGFNPDIRKIGIGFVEAWLER